MKADGYMVDAEYDGATLTMRGHNKAARIALAGRDHATDVMIPRDRITAVDLKPASMLVNGTVTVHTVDGGKHVLHFRKKQAPGIVTLCEALQR